MISPETGRELGFGKQVDRAEQEKCPFCNKEVDMQGFRDEKSKKEHGLSGLCQKCQDKMFGRS